MKTDKTEAKEWTKSRSPEWAGTCCNCRNQVKPNASFYVKGTLVACSIGCATEHDKGK